MIHYLSDGDVVVAGIRQYTYKKGELIRRNLKPVRKGVTIQEVAEAVSLATGVTKFDLSAHTRKQEAVRARKAYCYYLYNYAGLTTQGIAKVIDRKHANVIHLKECWYNDLCLYSYVQVLDQIITNQLNVKRL